MAETTEAFRISDVGTGRDADSIASALESLDGVMGASVDDDGVAEVRFDQDILAEERVRITVEELGYEVEEFTVGE